MLKVSRSPFAIFLAESRKRRALALSLRAQNLTFTAIGKQLGITRQRAERMVKKAEKENGVTG